MFGIETSASFTMCEVLTFFYIDYIVSLIITRTGGRVYFFKRLIYMVKCVLYYVQVSLLHMVF